MKNIFYMPIDKFKKSLCLLLFAQIVIDAMFENASAQPRVLGAVETQKNASVKWQAKPFYSPYFIENKGQFNGKNLLPDLPACLAADTAGQAGSKIHYGVDIDGYQIYFTPKGLTYRFDLITELAESDAEHREEKDKYSSEESDRKPRTLHPYTVNMQWLNSNPEVEIISQEVVSEFFTYANTENSEKTIGPAHGYKKLVYKNLYPGIDAEYVFHPSGEGIKYSLILHPGADPSKIKMLYSGAESMSKDADGALHFVTPGGSIKEYAPKTFYSSGKTPVESAFVLNGNTISFNLHKYDASQTVVIDPWTTPVAVQMTTNGKGFDVGRDAAGNVYVYGGYLNYKLAKYTPAGVAVWTYVTPYDQDSHYGDLAVHPPTGDCIITEGCCNVSGSVRRRINSITGTVMWAPIGPAHETWNIAINPCNPNQIVAGGFGINSPSGNGLLGALNLATGAYTVIGNPLGTIIEIRSLTISPGGNIYGLTCPLIQNSTGTGNYVVATTPTFGLLYNIPSTYLTMTESGTFYTTSGAGGFSGQNGIVADNCFLYTTNGGILHKRNIATGAILDTFLIPNGAPENNSGIEVDDCGNVYVGSMTGVYKVDPALTLLSFSPTGGAVYDVRMNSGGEILACGNGFVASLAMSACAPVSCGGVLTLSVSTTPSICGSSNGSASVTAAGGIPPYTYAWSNGQTTSSITGLSVGTYTVTVTATGGCLVNSTTATILNSNGPVAALTQTDILCNGQCTGAVTANVSGGGSPYTYSWSNGQSTSAISSLCPGTYSVLVTDANGCTDAQTTTLFQPPAMVTSVTGNNSTCNGGTGSATATAQQGNPSPPFTFLWSNGQNAPTVTNILAGNYTVTITNPNGCTNTLTVAITEPAVLSASVSATNVTCNGANDGSATANVNGGTLSYTYLWSNGATASQITNLSSQIYSVTITDNNGCVTTQTVSITEPPLLSATVSATDISCNGANDGSATANVNGGTSSYTYLWSNGATTSQIINLISQIYSVTVTDNNGCTVTQTVSINEPIAIAVTVTSTTATCSNNDGSASVTSVSGGTSPYTYLWSNGQTTTTATGLVAGNYTIIITDGNGCIQKQTVTVISNSTLIVTATSTQTGCTINNGTATANPNSGTSPYTYTWYNGQTTQTATGLAAGTYTVTVTDATICALTQTVSVTITNGAIATASAAAINITLGGNTQLTAAGGVAYSWSPSTGLTCIACANPIASPNETTGYCVFVTDGNSCTDSACITINVEIPCEALFVPNAFSPNGDSENDLECVIGNCITTMTFAIYNRWGEKVFETNEPKVCWDGKFRGELQNSGVYVYRLTGTTLLGEPIDRKGNISLVR